MNILFAINQKFTDLLCSCIRSIVKYGGADHYNAYILHSDLQTEDKTRIALTAGECMTCHYNSNFRYKFPMCTLSYTSFQIVQLSLEGESVRGGTPHTPSRQRKIEPPPQRPWLSFLTSFPHPFLIPVVVLKRL